jgi:sugar lactone lactonase YvrE
MAVTPDDSTLIVSESFAGTLTAFDIGPDGSLSNRRVWAALPGGGIVLDTEGAVWTPGWTEAGPACLRVAEGGEVLDTVPLDRAGFACTLGGEDGRTLFMLAADWRMQGGFEDNIERLTTGPETGQVLTARARPPTPATPERPARSSSPGRPRGQPGKAECEPRITGGLVSHLRGSSRGRGDR